MVRRTRLKRKHSKSIIRRLKSLEHIIKTQKTYADFYLPPKFTYPKRFHLEKPFKRGLKEMVLREAPNAKMRMIPHEKLEAPILRVYNITPLQAINLSTIFMMAGIMIKG